MVKVLHSYDVPGSIIALYSTQDALYFTNNQSTLYCVEKTQWSLKSFLIDDTMKPLHPYHKGSAFGQNGFGLYSSQQNHCSALSYTLPVPVITVSNRTVNILKQIPKPLEGDKLLLYGHDQPAEAVTFAGEHGEYLFTGGTDGKVYMFSSESGEILMSLKPKPDYIAHIRLNDNGTSLAYSAYDRSIHVLDLRYHIEMLHAYPGDVIEDSIFFNHSNSLYAISRNGVSYIFDLRAHTTDAKALFPTWPSCCVIENSGRFAIVGTRSGYIHIIRLADNTQFSSHQLGKKGISSLCIDDSILYIGYENGTVQVIDMHAFISQFSAAISDKEYYQAKKYLDENFFLSIHPVSELFDEAWDDVLQEIRSQLSRGNKTDLFELAEPFLDDGKHKQEFDFLYLKQKEFENFSILVQEKKYFDAYGMLERAPYLNKTDNYRKLESYFAKAMHEAKKLIAESPLLNMEKVKEILAPFASIPLKKEIVYTLIKHGEIFLQADEHIKTKNFKKYFELTLLYPILTEEEMYTKLCSIAEKAIIKIRQLITQQMFDDALQGVRQLIGFLPYKAELSKLVFDIQIRKKVIVGIENNDLRTVYELVAMYPDLNQMNEFIDYEKKFDQSLSQAMMAIGKGEIELTKAVLAPYAEIPIFKLKIRECIRQATWNKLNLLFKEKNIASAKITVSYYLKEFGKDHDLERLLKKYGLFK